MSPEYSTDVNCVGSRTPVAYSTALTVQYTPITMPKAATVTSLLASRNDLAERPRGPHLGTTPQPYPSP